MPIGRCASPNRMTNRQRLRDCWKCKVEANCPTLCGKHISTARRRALKNFTYPKSTFHHPAPFVGIKPGGRQRRQTAVAQKRTLGQASYGLGSRRWKCFAACMNKASKIILVGLAAVSTFDIGYETGQWRALEHERRLHDWNGSIEQAQDAAKRWAAKVRETPSMAMSNRYARYMAFPDKNCIQLRLRDGLGGEPIYCYRSSTLQLVEEYSDVE